MNVLRAEALPIRMATGFAWLQHLGGGALQLCSKRKIASFLFAACLFLLAYSSSLTRGQVSLAQEPPSPDANSVSKTLSDQSFPWYDEKTQSGKPIHIVADGDETGQRDSTWLSSGNWQSKRSNFRPNFTGIGKFFQILIWLLVAAGLLGLSYLVIVAFMKMDAKLASGEGGLAEEDDEEEDKTRIENLPFQVKRPNSNLLAEARACYERGEYNDAIVYLYSHQLIELDRRQAIYLTKGKTNRQYLRELRERPAVEKILESSILLFEEAFFGQHLISKEQMDRCWEKLPEFDRELERITT